MVMNGIFSEESRSTNLTAASKNRCSTTFAFLLFRGILITGRAQFRNRKSKLGKQYLLKGRKYESPKVRQ